MNTVRLAPLFRVLLPNLRSFSQGVKLNFCWFNDYDAIAGIINAFEILFQRAKPKRLSLVRFCSYRRSAFDLQPYR